MDKIDLKKELKQLYGASAKAATVVEVPPLGFLMIDGHGDPNKVPEFEPAVQALFAAAYALKFRIKKGPSGLDYTVMPLEGLWWADDMRDFAAGRKDRWRWTLMILQPRQLTPALFDEVRAEIAEKKPGLPLAQLRLERCAEGLAAQILHLGPYDGEAPTIAKLHDFVKAQGCELHGNHHEIYLGDPRKTAAEKLKTILRQPMVRKP